MAPTRGNSGKFILQEDIKRITEENTNADFSVGLIADNLYTWEVVIFGPKDTPFESGIFKAEMVFPLEYPNSPPTFRFITPMWHPNIDKEGNVCISILHTPGEDEFGYEDLCERWLPVRTPESIILSISCLLNSPNCESPANVEASQQYIHDPAGYLKKVRHLTQKSLEYS